MKLSGRLSAPAGWAVLLFCLLAIAVYWPGLSGDYMFDDRPNLLDTSILGRTIGHPDTSVQRLPTAAFFFMQPTDDRGNLGRNTFRKGGIYNVNASLARTWSLSSEKSLTFRAESINLFNTPQFAEPGNSLGLPNFGQITNTLNDGRTFQFLLRFGF